jgi:hypothetical protein
VALGCPPLPAAGAAPARPPWSHLALSHARPPPPAPSAPAPRRCSSWRRSWPTRTGCWPRAWTAAAPSWPRRGPTRRRRGPTRSARARWETPPTPPILAPPGTALRPRGGAGRLELPRVMSVWGASEGTRGAERGEAAHLPPPLPAPSPRPAPACWAGLVAAHCRAGHRAAPAALASTHTHNTLTPYTHTHPRRSRRPRPRSWAARWRRPRSAWPRRRRRSTQRRWRRPRRAASTRWGAAHRAGCRCG